MSDKRNQELPAGEQVTKCAGEKTRSNADAHFPTFPLSRFRFGVWCLVFGICCFACLAASLKIELPAEAGVFQPGPGADIANGQCLVCHSVEYVVTQPPLPRAFWASSVKKMREKYGSAIPEEQVEPLLDYLTKHYGVGATNGAPATGSNSPPTKAPATPPGTGLNAETIATKYGCLGCHNVSVKIVGPSYREIAAKYRDDAGALMKISEQIHKGGSGKWGPVIMPPFPHVTEAEMKALADWILRAK
jgi:cytochrome c551/c552